MKLLRGFTALVLLSCTSLGWAQGDTLAAVLKGEHRLPANVARDQYRHPVETLRFFEVTTRSTVVEIWPGMGWYTELLAPYLKNEGKLYAAHFPAKTEVRFFQQYRQKFSEKLAAAPAAYERVSLSEFHPPSQVVAGPAGQLDRVLTFRNVHNWMKADYAQQAFTEFAALLKPGGFLGVVEHRAKPGTSLEVMIESGYVTEDHIITLARNAGLELAGSSEVNANSRDIANHPAGVWSLPPSLRLGDKDREKYLAIGESDRMTLKFRKPVAP